MRRGLQTCAILACLAASAPALAQETPDANLSRLGLTAGEPLVPSALPSIPFGVRPSESKDFVLDFHGYLLLPMVLGVHDRPNPEPGQSGTALHSPPEIPQYLRGFEYTAAIPNAWGQLNFTYGNSVLSATTILAAESFTDGAGYYDPTKQLGVSDAFLTFNLSKPVGIPFEVNVGAMTGRFGAMGSYDAGRYGTPLIARTNTIGETILAAVPAGRFRFLVEQGWGGQFARPPVGLVPAGWNDFSNPNVGATFVAHLHAGVAYCKVAELGLHYLTAWTQDDLTPGGLVPDGRISVYGADAHLSGRLGHLFLGVARTQASNAGSVSGAIEVLNAQGGPDLIAGYLGPNSNGNGALTTFGVQYDLSVAHALYYQNYKGHSADVLVSLFGIGTKVESHDPQFDGVFKLKVGAEVTYDFLSWMGVSERFDHVRLNASDDTQAFSIFSSRIFLHTSWLARDEFALQWSYFADGAAVYVRTGYPPTIDPTYNPDLNVLSLSGTFWW
ncbi:MAG TPA: hypothetical protein VGM06_21030 [Polyangiaceae bacterium]|jgi:hypothetical protein